MIEQPSGTVTMVFTDIEGSTRLLDELGVRVQGGITPAADAWRGMLGRFEGYEVDTRGTHSSMRSRLRARSDTVLEAMEVNGTGPSGSGSVCTRVSRS